MPRLIRHPLLAVLMVAALLGALSFLWMPVVAFFWVPGVFGLTGGGAFVAGVVAGLLAMAFGGFVTIFTNDVYRAVERRLAEARASGEERSS